MLEKHGSAFVPDVHDKLTRSRNMRAIKSKHTAPELLVRSSLHRAGFRYALHSRETPGRPDLKLTRHNVVVFVHGCFWHGHECKRTKMPKSRMDYWEPKISSTRRRDKRKSRALRSLGWRVITVWECELKKPRLLQSRLLRTIIR